MAASSVTGVGPGDSNGKQKPELHSGCGCCSGSQTPKTMKTKKFCHKKYSSCSRINYKIKTGINKINSCF
jgi:hypothetical protein